MQDVVAVLAVPRAKRRFNRLAADQALQVTSVDLHNLLLALGYVGRVLELAIGALQVANRLIICGLGSAFIRLNRRGFLIAPSARVAKYLRGGFVSGVVAIRTVLVIVVVIIPALGESHRTGGLVVRLLVIRIPVVVVAIVPVTAAAIPMRVFLIRVVFSSVWPMILGLLLLSPIVRLSWLCLPSIVAIVPTGWLLWNGSG